MVASQLLMGELDEAIRCGSSDKRVETLRRITDLFLCNADRFKDQQIDLFGNVLGRLIEHVENKALSELGQRLAPTHNAPIEVLRQLASNDEITVAGPVLSVSTQLMSADLVDIARSKGQGHLLAISCRSELQEDVTDILVDRGDSEVARSVAGNRGARFSATGFSNLVERARQDEGLAERVAVRSEMSPGQLQQLALKATDAVRQRLMSVSNLEAHAKIEKVLIDIAAEIDRSVATRQRDYAVAQDLVSSLQHDKALLKAKLVKFAAQEKFEEIVAALSALSGLKIDATEQCLTNSDEGGVLILCRAIRLEWATVCAILTLESVPQRSASLQELAMRYAKLSNATAERILRFWKVRTTVTASPGQRQPPEVAAAAEINRGWEEWSVP
jgi:uncharacterized protein (DUF2336 family)